MNLPDRNDIRGTWLQSYSDSIPELEQMYEHAYPSKPHKARQSAPIRWLAQHPLSCFLAACWAVSLFLNLTAPEIDLVPKKQAYTHTTPATPKASSLPQHSETQQALLLEYFDIHETHRTAPARKQLPKSKDPEFSPSALLLEQGSINPSYHA